jgi:hypothetical protein
MQKPAKARKAVQRTVEEPDERLEEDNDSEEPIEDVRTETAKVGGFIPEPAPTAVFTVAQNDQTTTTVVDATVAMVLDIRGMTDAEIGQSFRDLRVEVQVKRYCKTKLFHWLKFIDSRAVLSSLTKKSDIGNVVMDKLNVNSKVDAGLRPKWWLLYQDVVRKALDTQRNNCNMAIKSVMIGELVALTKLNCCMSFS